MPLSLCILYSLFLSLLGFQSRFADALLRELAGVTTWKIIWSGNWVSFTLWYIWSNWGLALHYINTSTCFFFFLLLHFIDNFVFPKLIFSQQSQGRSVKEASENARTPRADTTVKILCFQRSFYLIYPLLRWFRRN